MHAPHVASRLKDSPMSASMERISLPLHTVVVSPSSTEPSLSVRRQRRETRPSLPPALRNVAASELLVRTPSASLLPPRQRRAKTPQARKSMQGIDWEALEVTEQEEQQPNVYRFKNYQIGESLGKGGYGRVFRGLNMLNGQFVAIKEVNFTAEQDISSITQEIRILQRLRHNNIVRYIDSHLAKPGCLHIVLEYVESGSLKDVISKFGSLPEPLTARYIFQVLQGLNYLHVRNIIHGDIKGANILITKDGICKLADFGVAAQLNPNGTTFCAFGTTYWTAPEVFEYSVASKASDVWSLGCTLIELITGSPPYRDVDPLVAVRKIMENDLPPFPRDATDELKDFLRRCFQKDPAERASTVELQNHPWMKKYGRRRSSSLMAETLTTNTSDELEPSLMEELGLAKTFTMDSIDDEEILKNVQERTPAIVSALQSHPFVWMNPGHMQQSALQKAFCKLQAENRMLQLLAQQLHEDIETPPPALPEKTEQMVSRVERSYVELSSEFKLAQTVYNTSDLGMNLFPHATRGILLVKRAGNLGSWKKRWIVLQDNFLFCYRPNSEDHPVNIIVLRDQRITPISEKDGGKKNCFLLTCASTSMYFAAARPEILVKWFNAIDQASAWYVPHEKTEMQEDMESCSSVPVTPRSRDPSPPRSRDPSPPSSQVLKRATIQSRSKPNTPELSADSSPRAVRFSELPPSSRNRQAEGAVDSRDRGKLFLQSRHSANSRSTGDLKSVLTKPREF